MLSDLQRKFLERQRVGRLATADVAAVPQVVPVCFALCGMTIHVAIDAKPKSGPPSQLKRLRNIAENPVVSLVFDHYEDDWTRLGWVMIRGRADMLTGGPEHAAAHASLRGRYPQYRTMALEGLPVIAVRIERVTSWGALD